MLFIFIHRRRTRQRQRVEETAYHASLHSAKIYDQHLAAPSDVIGSRQCYQTVVHGKGNDYDYTMELRPLPTVPAYTADLQAKCPQSHCQCFSPYDSFHYGSPNDSQRVAVRTAPPHYFTLDPKRQHEPSCMLTQPDVTQTPLIATAFQHDTEDKDEQCPVHKNCIEDPQHNDSGTCSWP